jgi:hypothetical protein
MAKNYKSQVEKDIAAFKATGKLPQDYDVKPVQDVGTYWDWYEKWYGQADPLDNVVDENTEFYAMQAHGLSALIKEQLEKTLNNDQLEVYYMIIERGMTEREAATILMRTNSFIHRRMVEIENVIKKLRKKAEQD